MQRIFISYRRSDSETSSGALARDLRERFGKESVFRDKEDIEGGAKWLQNVEQQISDRSTLLVLIGKTWLDQRDTAGNRRIDNPTDIVRKEITLGLEKGANVIPVLLEDARMPQWEELPEPLKPLADYNAVQLRDGDWEHDLQRMTRAIEQKGFKRKSSDTLASGKRKLLVAAFVASTIAILAIGASVGLISFASEQCQDDKDNLLRNCGFEDGLNSWGSGYYETDVYRGSLDKFWAARVGMQMEAMKIADVRGDIDSEIRKSGTKSFKITNNSPLEAHVYGSMSQRVSGLLRNTDYIASFWAKAERANKGTFEITSDLKWLNRKHIDAGTYDWKEFSHVFNTGESTFIDFRIVSEEPGTVWVDEIKLKRHFPRS